MNSAPKLLAIVFALRIMTFAVTADELPNIPPSSWDQHAEGVSAALVLVQWTDNGHQKDAIKVYIKNISTAKKYLPNDFNDRAVQIYYIDANGKHVSLRDYAVKVPRVVLMPALPNSRPYEPGIMRIKTIDLTPNELALVEKYPVICRFYISDQEVGGYKLIESSPKLLTATVIPAPNK